MCAPMALERTATCRGVFRARRSNAVDTPNPPTSERTATVAEFSELVVRRLAERANR
jgi:hypothetical protein